MVLVGLFQSRIVHDNFKIAFHRVSWNLTMNVSRNTGRSGGEYEPLTSSESKTRICAKGRKCSLGKLPFLHLQPWQQ